MKIAGSPQAFLCSPMGYYQGEKDSERTVVEQYFKVLTKNELSDRNFTLDALHTTPELLAYLHQQGSGYVVGVKANQQVLLDQAQWLGRH